MATYSSLPQAFGDLRKRLEKLVRESPAKEMWIFNKYYAAITYNVPMKTGATRQFPTRRRGAAFKKNQLIWQLPYTMKVYNRNKTGKPRWDMYTANKINTENTEDFIQWSIKFFK